MNTPLYRITLLVILALVSIAGYAQTAREQVLNDPEAQKLLRAMNNAGTWYHPDLDGEFSGVHA